MRPGTVVSMHAAEHDNRVHPPAYLTAKHLAQKHIVTLMQGLFDSTDDALFGLSDKAQSDQQQEMYFDAMRHVRLNRKAISEEFLERLSANFDLLLDLSPEQNPDLDRDEYTLIELDELEMSVAVSGIASKVTSIFSLPIMQLTKRFGEVVKHRDLTERLNPLGPHALSTAFAESLGGLEVNIKVRIILMKLFERFVMERMGPVYDEVNNKLIEAGVLPELKDAKPSRRPVGQKTSSDGPQTPEPQEDTFGFETIQSLLSTVRSPGSYTGGVTPGGSGALDSSGVAVIQIPSVEVLSVLGELQKVASMEQTDPGQVPQPADVKDLLIAHAGGDKSLGQADDDTVNFIGMLFDYILNDRNLAIPMKALIGRLQIPLVKLALLDKSFFSNSVHPARLLLNELSSAGIGWSSNSELKRDPLYNKIEEIVAGVLGSFNDDPAVFNELLRDLRSFTSQDTKRSILVEQRVKDTELGKSKTQEAKTAVQSLINQKACGLRLPSQLGTFLSDVWSRVLTLRWVKFGESSPRWHQAVHTLDTLLWALQPLSEPVDIAQRDEVKPDLLAALKEGVMELGSHADGAAEFEQWLEDHLQSLSENDRAYLEDDAHPEQDVSIEEFPEIILTSTDMDATVLNEAQELLLKPYTEGTWIEMTDAEGSGIGRCKLSTVTKSSRTYIFVNRRGMKVCERKLTEMLTLVENGQIQLIDESQVFDRALQSVIGNLRKLHRHAS